MHELSFPAAITLPITDTLASIPTRRAAESPNRPMYALRAGDGWTDVTAREFNDLVRSVARGLVARGIEVGQPVAILSPTRYEWTVLDFALWTAGAFAVPDLRLVLRRADRVDPAGQRRGGRHHGLRPCGRPGRGRRAHRAHRRSG